MGKSAGDGMLDGESESRPRIPCSAGAKPDRACATRTAAASALHILYVPPVSQTSRWRRLRNGAVDSDPDSGAR